MNHEVYWRVKNPETQLAFSGISKIPGWRLTSLHSIMRGIVEVEDQNSIHQLKTSFRSLTLLLQIRLIEPYNKYLSLCPRLKLRLWKDNYDDWL